MAISYAVGQRLTATLLQTLADYTVNSPRCRLVQQAAQSCNDNTDTAITYGSASEIVDTHGFHDESTNNTRITPNVAGYYTVYAVFFIAAAADYVNLQTNIRMNGATIQPSSTRHGPNATSASRSVAVHCESILFNGSTDYVEHMGNQDNTAAAARNTASTGSSASCVFGVIFERPA